MKVRKANKFDFPQVLEMLHRFKVATPVNTTNDCQNNDHVAVLYTMAINGKGVVFVAEKDNTIVGLIMGLIDPIVWDPNVLVMREIAYWVDVEHRGGTAGYRLLQAFIEYGDELVEQGRIQAYTMSKLTNSPNLKFDRFGLDKVEEVWVGGNV